jgi:hypothetical protein
VSAINVVSLTQDDLMWDWDTGPYWKTRPALHDGWGTREKVDPTPAYGHDAAAVAREAEYVHTRFPIGVPTTIHVAQWESLSRTNGWCSQDWGKDAEGNRVWEASIALGGKRIPPLPAMTRYLVSHEYGHAVDNWLCEQREVPVNGLDEEYAKLRDLAPTRYYGPGAWHLNVGEVIANDFRIIVARREVEFWPHPTTHPLEDKAVKAWWRKALKEAAR